MFRRQLLPATLRGTTTAMTGRDLARAGVSPDGVRSLVDREITRLSEDLYVLGTEPTWDQHLAAAVELGGPGSVAFRRSALALHGLLPRELPVEVMTSSHHQPRSRSWVRFVRSDLPSRSIEDHEPRRVGLEDSVVDMVGISDELDAIALVHRALQERRTTPARLRTVVDRRRRVRHRTVLEHVLDDAEGIESVLERMFDDRVLAPHDMPPMVRQFVVPGSGHRSDGAYLATRQLIELDGAQYHDPKADQALDNRHAALGWSTFRFGWADCWVRPCMTARIMCGGAPPKRCRRCPGDA